jgi:hypothetical protein
MLCGKTSFTPHFLNKTTSVAEDNPHTYQPHYQIPNNEIMRFFGGFHAATEVVLLFELGRNEVFAALQF